MAGLAGVMPGQVYNISTVAGSPTNNLGDDANATLAGLIGPVSAVVDAAGNVYIADTGTQVTGTTTLTTNTIGLARIRKINGTTGVITTLTSALSTPRG